MKPRFISEEHCLSLNKYDRALNVLRAWPTEACALCEQRVYADQDFRAQKSMLHSYVLIQEESDGNKER